MEKNSIKKKRLLKSIFKKPPIILVVVVIIIGTLSLSGCDEDNNWEVAAEWINDYEDVGKPNLRNRDDCARGFYDHIRDQPGWAGRFCLGDADAWEEHWKCSDWGGTDRAWVDLADIAYFSGHGCGMTGLGRGDCVTFGKDAHDDWILQATPEHWEPKWGDQDLEWVILDVCSALALEEDGEDVIHTINERWANSNVMHGLHYILGFRTVAYDNATRGEIFAEYLTGDRDGVIYEIRDAWLLATQDTEITSVEGAYLRAYSPGRETLNDHLWGYGSVGGDPIPEVQSYGYVSWWC